MKVIQKKKIIEDGLLDQFIKELKIQAYLKHPNIIEVYGFFEDEKHFYTLMELGCDGQLYNLIFEKKKLTEEGTSFITKNLLQAVDYMHDLKILHRDIKPENIVRIMVLILRCRVMWKYVTSGGLPTRWPKRSWGVLIAGPRCICLPRS